MQRSRPRPAPTPVGSVSGENKTRQNDNTPKRTTSDVTWLGSLGGIVYPPESGTVLQRLWDHELGLRPSQKHLSTRSRGSVFAQRCSARPHALFSQQAAEWDCARQRARRDVCMPPARSIFSCRAATATRGGRERRVAPRVRPAQDGHRPNEAVWRVVGSWARPRKGAAKAAHAVGAPARW